MGSIKDRLLSTVYTAIPAKTVVSDANDTRLDSFDFASDDRRSFSHEAVGSGTPNNAQPLPLVKSTRRVILSSLISPGVPIVFDIEGHWLETVTLLTAGQLQAKVSWGVDALGNPLVPITPQSNIGSVSQISCHQ